MKTWLGDSAHPLADLNTLRDEGAEAVLLPVESSGGDASESGPDVCLGVNSQRVHKICRAAESVAGAGLQLWLCLDHRALDNHRAQFGLSGRLLATQGNSQSPFPDYADLRCQTADRRLVDSIIDAIPGAAGFVLGAAMDPAVLAVDNRFYSPKFLREFRDRFQCDLRQALTPETAITRRNYYAAWSDMLFRLQSSVARAIRCRRGPRVPIVFMDGSHPTHAPVDVYRLARSTADGIIGDGNPPENVSRAVARSVAKYLPRRLGWTVQPDGWLEAIPPEASESVDVAVVWNWGAEAALDATLRARYRRSLGAVCRLLDRESISYDIVPPDVITTAEEPTETGGFRRREGEYGCVLYPYGWMLRPIDWEILESFADSGGRLLFYGAGPQVTTDGRLIAEQFGKLIGATTARLEARTAMAPGHEFVMNGCRYPAINGECLFYPMATQDALVTAGDSALGVRRRNTVYLTMDAPLCCPDLFVQVTKELRVDNG